MDSKVQDDLKEKHSRRLSGNVVSQRKSLSRYENMLSQASCKSHILFYYKV